MDAALKLHYQQIVETWEDFCRLHRDLYDAACDEYMLLLEGDLDAIEGHLQKKESIVAEIATIEQRRSQTILSLNQYLPTNRQVNTIKELLNVMSEIERQMPIPALERLNLLLVDIITKIQDQNKKNQLYLNKAMLHVRELREGFSGRKKSAQYVTYGADGMATRAGAR